MTDHQQHEPEHEQRPKRRRIDAWLGPPDEAPIAIPIVVLVLLFYLTMIAVAVITAATSPFVSQSVPGLRIEGDSGRWSIDQRPHSQPERTA